MSGAYVARIVVLVVTLHVAVLSVLFGPRLISRIMAAVISAALIYGAALLLHERRRPRGLDPPEKTGSR